MGNNNSNSSSQERKPQNPFQNKTYPERQTSNSSTNGVASQSTSPKPSEWTSTPLLCQTCYTRHAITARCTLQSTTTSMAPNTSTTDEFVFIPSRVPPGQKELCPRCCKPHSPFDVCPVTETQPPQQRFVPCSNKVFGCHEEHTDNHYESCPYTKAVCPVGKYLGSCNWSGGKCKLSDHVNDAHPNNIIYKLSVENRKNNITVDDGKWDIQVISHESQIFVLYMKTIDPWFYCGVQLVGSACNAAKWSYKIEMFIKSNKGKRIKITEPCTSNCHDIGEMFAAGKCAGFPVNCINNFITNRNELHFTLDIFKYVKKQQTENNRNRGGRRGKSQGFTPRNFESNPPNERNHFYFTSN